jgi:hypothetical protein
MARFEREAKVLAGAQPCQVAAIEKVQTRKCRAAP